MAYRRDVPGDGKNQWKETEITTENSEFLLKDVKCGSIYSLRIKAENYIGQGKFSKPITTRTRGSGKYIVKVLLVNFCSICTIHCTRPNLNLIK